MSNLEIRLSWYAYFIFTPLQYFEHSEAMSREDMGTIDNDGREISLFYF